MRLKQWWMFGVAGLALASTSLVAADARAITAWSSDCNFGFQSSYNPGDAVCVTGEVDVVPPGEFFGAAYVHIVPAGSPNPFADVTLGGANYVLGTAGGGAFFDEYVWLPPLKPGSYELVLDQHPFGGTFDPALDWRSNGVEFTVKDAPIVLSVDVLAIKLAALEGVAFAKGIHTLTYWLGLIDALGTGADWLVNFGKWPGIVITLLGVAANESQDPCDSSKGFTLPPTSYNSAVITIGNTVMNGIGCAVQKKYETLAADPPDPNFMTPVAPALDELSALPIPLSPVSHAPFPRGQFAVAQLLAVQAAAIQSFVPTFEKLQGAQAAGSNAGMYLQAQKTMDHAGLALSAGNAMLVELDAMEAELSNLGILDAGPDVALLQAERDALAKDGLTGAQMSFLKSFGFSDADVEKARQSLLKAEVPPVITYGALLDQARGSFEAMKADLEDVRAQAQAVRDENQPYAFVPAPEPSIAPPTAGSVGAAIALQATAAYYAPGAALSYAWDTDLDGAFDDGTGASFSWIPKAPGRHVVAVRVTDGGGAAGVAFTTVDVAASNAPPAIDSVSPADPAPFAGVQEAVAFEAQASDADGDALTIRWLVDGAEAATGATYSFTMPDEEPHEILAIVSDGDAYTPEARTRWVVRAAKWKGKVDDGQGGGGSGAGNSGGGGEGGGNGGAPAGSAGSEGCTCSIPSGADPGSPAPWLALALATTLAARRARRRPLADPGSTSTGSRRPETQ